MNNNSTSNISSISLNSNTNALLWGDGTTDSTVYISEIDALSKTSANTIYLNKNDALTLYATLTSLSNYLTTSDANTIYSNKTDASTLYATLTSLSNYLTTSDANTIYLSKNDASTLYAPIGSASDSTKTQNITATTCDTTINKSLKVVLSNAETFRVTNSSNFSRFEVDLNKITTNVPMFLNNQSFTDGANKWV